MAISTLVASGVRTASSTSTATAIYDKGVELLSAQILLDVTAAATVAADTLDVYVQSSPDGGTAWHDFLHFTQVLGDGGTKQFVAQVVFDAIPTIAMQELNDASLVVGTEDGPIGGQLRVKWVIAGTGSFTFAVKMDSAIRKR